jgi:molecular chaperone DnaJ
VPSTDYYALLGVAPDASQEEIKRAYRSRARELHPDRNPGDPEAEARFKEIAMAYETLCDPQRRRRYDQFGPQGPGGGDPFGGGGLGDIFEAFFGGQSPFGGGGTGFGARRSGPPAGADLEVIAEVSFVEAVFGTQTDIGVRTAVACEECEASGAAPGTKPRRCPDCDGIGQVRTVRQSILGQMVSTGVCPRCSGLGETVENPCPACRGEGRRIEEKSYTVDIPAGVDSGQTLRLTGRGAVGPRGGRAGDLYVHIKAASHERFERAGNDLLEELHLPFTQAALGAHLPYETLDGPEDLVVPPGTQSGRVFRLRGRGVPRLDARGRGDLLVRIVVDIPERLSDDEDELVRRLAEVRGEVVAPRESGFFSKIRSAFR